MACLVKSNGYWHFENKGKRYRVGRMIAEAVLGKPLPKGAVVHHVNDKSNDIPSNLVICQDRAYHNLLHSRERALKACGNANFRQCRYCKGWDNTENLHYSPRNGTHRHLKCHAEYEYNRKQKLKENRR